MGKIEKIWYKDSRQHSEQDACKWDLKVVWLSEMTREVRRKLSLDVRNKVLDWIGF